MNLIRAEHKWYDLYHILNDPRLMVFLLLVSVVGMLAQGLRLIYPILLLFLMIFVVKGVIGRRCPRCDGPLKEFEATKRDGLTFDVAWRCPRDGYQEFERVRGGIGSWGDSG